jgi:NAD(P)-dependent dehydrogenase (short-subunit alcohol dehydrogenase family)
MRFAGKVALVSGGTGALGSAVSLALLNEGAKVAVTYRRSQEFDSLRSKASANQALLLGYRIDLTDPVQIHQLVDQIQSDFGRLDFLVNAVGGYAGGTKLWELDPAVFGQMMEFNLRAGFLLCRAAVPAMLKQTSGAVVDVVSKAAFDHAAGAAAYAASKAGALAMMDSLAADLKGTGLRVNSILPSIIDTEANRKAMPGSDFTKWPKPEDIAKVILFLLSDDARVIHGAAIPVYGES